MSLALEILRKIYPPKGPCCKRGHRMTSRNTYCLANGEKLCKRCSNNWSKTYYWRNVEQQRARKRKTQ